MPRKSIAVFGGEFTTTFPKGADLDAAAKHMEEAGSGADLFRKGEEQVAKGTHVIAKSLLDFFIAVKGKPSKKFFDSAVVQDAIQYLKTAKDCDVTNDAIHRQLTSIREGLDPDDKTYGEWALDPNREKKSKTGGRKKGGGKIFEDIAEGRRGSLSALVQASTTRIRNQDPDEVDDPADLLVELKALAAACGELEAKLGS